MNPEILKSINKGEVAAIIPARSGSKGVPNKNIRSLDGYPMIAYSIAAAKTSRTIGMCLVSTDSKQYAEIAGYYGADVPFIRPAELASDQSTDIDFMEHAIGWLYENRGSVPEYFVHLRPTYPLRDADVVDRAVQMMLDCPQASSLRSAHACEASPYKWFRLEDGFFRPIVEGMTLDDANKPRQVFPQVYIPDGYVDVLKTESIVRTDTMHGDRMIGFLVDDGVDVDSLKEFELVKQMVASKDFPVKDYLKNNYKTTEEIGL